MELLYNDAVVTIVVEGKDCYLKSISGYMGEKRPNECRDPNKVVIEPKEFNQND